MSSEQTRTPSVAASETTAGHPNQAEPGELYLVREGLVIEPFASGLALPVNLALNPRTEGDPDAPLLYVTELYGRVRTVYRDGTVGTLAAGLLNFEPSDNFPGAGESGVTGIAADPASGDVFVSLVYREDRGLWNRVLRLRSSPDGAHSEGSDVLLDGIPSAPAHQVQAVSVGPDGKLYVNLGDGNTPEAARDGGDLRGKVLRLNLDGSVPKDNPTPGSPVFAKGFRNPFGAAWHPARPWLYVSDNAPADGDRIARVDPGDDYGWCCDQSRNALVVFAREAAISPTALAFDAEHLLTPPDETHLLVAISGPTYVRGATAFGKKIFDLKLSEGGAVDEVTELLRYVGGGYSSVIGMAFGPDGLYFSDLYGEDGFDRDPVTADIYRVFPAGTTPPPSGALFSPSSSGSGVAAATAGALAAVAGAATLLLAGRLARPFRRAAILDTRARS